MSNRSQATIDRMGTTPSAVAARSDKMAQDFEALRTWLRWRCEGCLLSAPTTPSAQAAGVGNTTWNVNIDIGVTIINAVAVNQAEAVDQSIHAGSLLAGLISGASCVAAIVAYGAAGTKLVVKGTPATTGAQVAPTDAVIQAAVDVAAGVASTVWLKIGQTTLNRTGDATVTQSYDNTARPMAGVNEDLTLGYWG